MKWNGAISAFYLSNLVFIARCFLRVSKGLGVKSPSLFGVPCGGENAELFVKFYVVRNILSRCAHIFNI